MADRERVIEGLRKAAEELARYAPMKVNGRCQMYFDGAIYLLKEQEPVELLDDGEDFVSIGDRMDITHRWKCGGCGNFVVYCETRPKIKFCHLCGREFKRG